MPLQRIGILSLGEMGYHWARLLGSRGVRVFTYSKGRSEVTRKRGENAGVESVASMKRLVSETDLIVSLVIPSAAKRVATGVAKAMAAIGKTENLFLDANAISPMTARQIEKEFSAFPQQLVDGCVIGSAARVGHGTLVYLSGPQSHRLEELKDYGLSVRVLGSEIGQASAFKIVYAGLTKGLQGLFVELLVGARKFGLLGDIMRQYEESFPGLLGKVAPSIVGLKVHAARRAEEMTELGQTYRDNGLRAVMAPATKRLLRAVAALEAGAALVNGEREGSLLETLELFFDKGLLQEQRPE